MIPDEAVEAAARAMSGAPEKWDRPDETAVAHVVRAAAWGNCTPEEAARQILEHLHPTIWPRRVPAYGTTGTRRIRKAAK